MDNESNNLEAKINDFKKSVEKPVRQVAKKGSASVAIDLCLAVVISGVFGYYIDIWLGCKPSALIFCLIFGFLGGFYNLYKASNKASTAPFVGILDMQTGNLSSLIGRLRQILPGVRIEIITTTPKHKDYDFLILPGVGAFGFFASKFFAINGLADYVKDFVKTKPLLGICVGMQFFFNTSTEGGTHSGLGLIDGDVIKIDSHNGKYKVPHMGWNSIMVSAGCDELKNDSDFYFVHSYHCIPKDQSVVIATANYADQKIVAAVKSGNVFGVQFHPEKSSTNGNNFFCSFFKSIH